jgi:hypothetical protein
MPDHSKEAVFSALDTDGDGQISQTEFEAAYGKKVIAGPQMDTMNKAKAQRQASAQISPKPGRRANDSLLCAAPLSGLPHVPTRSPCRHQYSTANEHNNEGVCCTLH